MFVCVVIAKLLGVIWIVPVRLLIGEDGLGYYQNAYSFYVLLQQLATSGFPLAMGKLISERLAHGRNVEVEQIYRTTMRSVALLGVVSFLLMWFGAPTFASLIAVHAAKQAMANIVPSVRALSFLLLIIPFMSSYRGYLQGFQQLEAPAYSQAVEQLFRVIAMVVGAYIVVHLTHSHAAGAAAATFGAVVGGMAAFVLLMIAVRPLRSQFKGSDTSESPLSNRKALAMIYRVALPISLGGLVVPIAGLVDNFTVQNLLISVGETFHMASVNYGILTRGAVYLVQLPLAFVYAIGVSIIPALAAAFALSQQGKIQSTILYTLRSTLFLTFPVACILFVVSRPVEYVLFNSYVGASIVSAVAFMSIFSSLELISTYMLQGLGKMYRPVRNMFFGVIIKLIFNVILILALHSVMGAAIGTTIGYLFSSALNVMAVKKYGNVRFKLFRIALPFVLASLPTMVVLYGSERLLEFLLHGLLIHSRGTTYVANAIILIITCLLGMLIYLYATLRIGAIRPDELRQLPRIGDRLAVVANRIYRPRRKSVQPTHAYRDR